MQLTEVKHKLGLEQNLALNKVLLQSLKTTKDSPETSDKLKKLQRDLFLAAVSFENTASKELGISKEEMLSTKFDDLNLIIEFLNDLDESTSLIVQNLIDFLRVLSTFQKAGAARLDPKKYAAILQHIRLEMETEFSGGECTMFFDAENNVLTKALKSPVPLVKENLYKPE